MGAVFDANLMFRTTGNLTQSESCGPLTVYDVPIRGMTCQIVVPQASSGDTLLPKLYVSDDGTNYHLAETYGGLSGSATGITVPSGGGEYYLPFSPGRGKKYVKLELAVSGSGINFGEVKAGLVLGGGANIGRDVNWSL